MSPAGKIFNKQFCLLKILERWPRGLRRRFAKSLYGQNLYRGFESPPLRRCAATDPAIAGRLSLKVGYIRIQTLLTQEIRIL
jgi:hypothetical protein